AQSLVSYLSSAADADAVNRVYALYDRITPEDLVAAARKYLASSARTVVTLEHRNDAKSGGGGR
ncbi:MAG TPA: hypothetical protein VJ144_04465, partial [Candidatus Polarisedimenticolia bacterium]|nr:hypothetical protein [Candidatus Polarisedimenticolia bacterium]